MTAYLPSQHLAHPAVVVTEKVYDGVMLHVVVYHHPCLVYLNWNLLVLTATSNFETVELVHIERHIYN